MAKVFVTEEIDVYQPRNKRFWERLIMGDFDEWIEKKKQEALALRNKQNAN